MALWTWVTLEENGEVTPDDGATAWYSTLIAFSLGDYGVVVELERRYDDLDVGLADLSVVLAAHRYSTQRLLTFDERHFRALRPLGGGHFTLMPADTPRR